MTDLDLSVIGKTRPLSSILNFNPLVLKNVINLLLEKVEKADLKKDPLFPNFSMNMSNDALLVMLHLLLPVILSFLHKISFFSIKITLFPTCPARIAAIMPAGPAPTTAMS